MDGTVANMLRGSSLQGSLRLKSGSMSRVRCYAGYFTKGDTSFALAILVNNFSCTQAQMKTDIEQLLISLLP
jgi:D-alanyl-D-alanine carboxypeptidase/D-alanyl-D-alanine-endopeptidase (penicillin-binding protein 4)